MNIQALEEAIDVELAKRKKRVLNRNAFQSLFSAFADPIGALGRIFLGRSDALEAEKATISREVILGLLCRIDEAITEALATAKKANAGWATISGKIEVHGVAAENVTGVHITPESGPVELRAGTHIRATGLGVGNLTGLKIGGSDSGRNDK